MHNVGSLLLELVCINGKRVNVSVLDQKLRSLTTFGLIELAIGVNAFVSVLENGMSKNLIRVSVLMIPDQRNFLTVVAFERILANDSSIGALQIIACCPSAKIKVFHFDLIPPSFKIRLMPCHKCSIDLVTFRMSKVPNGLNGRVFNLSGSFVGVPEG